MGYLSDKLRKEAAYPEDQALKQLEIDTAYNPGKPGPGSEKEPVHVKFKGSHYGEHTKHGPHFATMVDGSNVHINDRGLFIIKPDGTAYTKPMNKQLRALLLALKKRTQQYMPKAAVEKSTQ